MALEGFDLQAFAQALSVPTQEALEMLPQLQRQPIAWQFAFELLKSANFNCRFFGAHTLQAKIARDWDSLDEERQEALRAELIRVVAEQCDAPLNVLNKANQALATYALRTVPDRWSNFLPSVISEIQQSASDAGKDSWHAGYAIVDFLELFPEELNRTTIGSVKHAKLIEDIKSSLPDVLELLTGIVQGLPGSTATTANVPGFVEQLGRDPVWRTRAWQAILQWLQFGIGSDKLFIPLLDLGLRQLEILAMHQLNGDGVVSDDEITAATASVEDMLSNMNMAAKYAQTIGTRVLDRTSQAWVSGIIKLSIDTCDEQMAMQWGSMLISFGETYTEFLVSRIADAQLSGKIGILMQILLALTRFPGYNGITENVSDQPLNFWYLLQEALVDHECEAGDDPSAAQSAAATKDAIRGVFLEVLRALVSKCAYPSTESWTDADKDERDKFASYRRDVGDALLNTYYVLREEMLGLLVDEVANNIGSFSMGNWQTIESLLFALKSIGEAVPESEAVHLQRLFSAELLSSHFMPVLQTSVDSGGDRGLQWGLTSVKASMLALIGAYGEWWKGHPELLPVVVPCVTSSLNQPALVQTAVAAFRSICESCREQLTEASESMVHLACEVLMAGAAVPAREQQRIFESVAEVVMAQPPDRQAATLAPLLSALASALDRSVQVLESAPRGASLADLEPYLEPLVDMLKLVESLARGLQIADDVEERAQVGDREAAGLLVASAQCYRSSPEMHAFRASLLALFKRIFALAVWSRDPASGLLAMDDTLLECFLGVVNSSTRRGPHALELGFGEVMELIASSWSSAIACPNPAGGTQLGSRWADQCPMFIQSISQLIAVVSTPPSDWQLARPSADESDRMLGATLTRMVDDIYVGIAQEAPDLATAIEQQPVINESLFDMLTRVLQLRPVLFASLEQSAVGHLCKLSVQALSVPNRLALRPTAYFLTALVRVSSSVGGRSDVSDLMSVLWSEFGPLWLRTTLAGIGGAHPRSLLPNLAELLFSMAKHHPVSVRALMAELLALPEFPSPHVSAADKRQFMQQVLATRSFIKAKGIVSEFSVKCRNLQDAGGYIVG
ncbi:hypothetical protein GGI15_000596 [Coemansia interrupta]|uniref:Importin-13 n=1 Tax=Coemansia interrupta TaxID=1126814 RepID=A0A9W8HLM8_9FUNG|nr:hypothetical protein GGI15_000596 [Coemansia interrupta]